MLNEEKQLEIISRLLAEIYIGHSAEKLLDVSSQLLQIIRTNSDIANLKKPFSEHLWDSSSAVLITYPDAVSRKGETTLKTLSELLSRKIGGLANIVHILPFLRSTSDGGFAVSSHQELEDKFGGWEDIKNISEKYYLMSDLILNHVSSSHKWVQEFIQSKEPGSNYILSPEKIIGWEKVIRPRNSALFITLSTKEGVKNAWTTFGADQIDLNWQNPSILVEFLKLIALYLRNGITWLRLDAVAFIWKEKNTSCLHRQQVHQIVKFLRYLLEELLPNPVIITETNVPESENLSYLRSGDEAHLAYNFPLPPLLLEALISNKADLLNKWLSNWPIFPPKTSFLNFTASHDGVGLRALEGLMDKERFHSLLVNCEKRGGLISHRRMENGEDTPYELNISWWSAMADGGIDPSFLQLQRFLLSQLLTMAIQGVPAFYLQSILASNNDFQSFGRSGQRRDLNREKFEADRLFYQLEDSQSLPSQILSVLKSAMKKRSQLESFHPESPMECLTIGRSDLIILRRGETKDKIWAIHNMTSSKLSLFLTDKLLGPNFKSSESYIDCLNNKLITDMQMELSPYNVKWLKKI